MSNTAVITDPSKNYMDGTSEVTAHPLLTSIAGHFYHVPGGFAVGAEPVRRPGKASREGVSRNTPITATRFSRKLP